MLGSYHAQISGTTIAPRALGRTGGLNAGRDVPVSVATYLT
jgi:hypothetical protein